MLLEYIEIDPKNDSIMNPLQQKEISLTEIIDKMNEILVLSKEQLTEAELRKLLSKIMSANGIEYDRKTQDSIIYKISKF